jgi:hypothetical protein
MGKYKFDHLNVPKVIDESKIVEIKLDPKELTAKAMERVRRAREGKITKKAKGGSVKKKSKFPDLSGDGKITKKDILMGRGVIKKGAKNGKK